jgi:hypothetical protein
MLLAAILGVSAFGWGCWLTYMVRYPDRWSAHIDRHRQRLLAMGVNLPLMHRLEKGPLLKVLVMLLCIAILLRDPTALVDFWHGLQRVDLA